MGRADFYRAGVWNVRCDECGAKYKSSELALRWDNLMVCANCWEPRHPQELIRPVVEHTALPYSRNPPNRFVNVFSPGDRLIDSYVFDSLTLG